MFQHRKTQEPTMLAYQQLKTTFERIYHLKTIQHIMEWDEAVIMPEGANLSRAFCMSTLSSTLQKMLAQKKVKTWIEQAKETSLDSPWDSANLMWMEKQYQAATCIPSKLAEQTTIATMTSQQMWRKLRAENNWRDFFPYLEASFRFIKEIAERKSEALHMSPYDALLDEYAPGFNQHRIDAIFNDLKPLIPPLLKEVMAKQQQHILDIPTGVFPIEQQKLLGLNVMKTLQFQFNNGRLDVSHHPFCGGATDDVRITTRYRTDEFLTSLMGICHETGHARYEQGLPRAWMFQPVGHVNSMAMHESQSLLLEMEVCRSKEFFAYITPLVIDAFGAQEALNASNLYHLATQVQPGLIRVDADEITYPLHVILRYEIEKELLNDTLSIKELPERWNDLMQTYLGLSTTNNDQNGVMQDVHWPSGAFGYFPAYTLGRLIAAQLFSTFKRTHPTFMAELRSGQIHLLHAWLTQNVYGNASLLSTDDLLLQVTGETLNPTFFLQGLKQRYLTC